MSPGRRGFLIAAAATTLAWGGWLSALAAPARDRFTSLEASSGGRLGIAALNTSNGASASHRADDRFAFCSTFKVLAASAILKRSASERGLLDQHMGYTDEEVEPFSPITSRHIGKGLTVAELCAAALQYSDNTAANLMIRLLGGPHAVTAFARSIGDKEFRLDRWETALNTAVPGDPRDSTTPSAMLRDLHGLAVGRRLGTPQRDQLVAWMRGNTTGAKRIRAAVPAGWSVADKTGTGDYGTTNDIAVVWPPDKPPIVIAVYFTQRDKRATPRDDVVASAAKVALKAVR